MNNNSSPVCQLVPESSDYQQVFLRQIDYELVKSKTLTLRLTSESGEFQLVFDSPCAVRVIDEGQVGEFWNDYHLRNGWLWEVLSGGFLNLESTRKTFWLKDISTGSLKEYLIVADQCVFVITNTPPSFTAIGTDL